MTYGKLLYGLRQTENQIEMLWVTALSGRLIERMRYNLKEPDVFISTQMDSETADCTYLRRDIEI